MYTLQLDQNKNFECKLKVRGASLNKSFVNLVIENGGFDIRLRGDIDKDGNVKIPIVRLKNIIEENSTGKMFLEVVAEDTYFVPYKVDYSTEISKKIEVESVESDSSSGKRIMVEVVEEPKKRNIHSNNILKEIASKNYSFYKPEHKTKIVSIIREYIDKNKINESLFVPIVKDIYSSLMDEK